MYRKRICIALILALFSFAGPIEASDFAAEVVDYDTPLGPIPYDDPNSVLGKPTRWISAFVEDFACSLVYAAWNTDPNGNKLITTIGDGGKIVVKFDHKVSDDPGNPYGLDFIVFGNTFFDIRGDIWLRPDTNMAEFYLANPTSTNDEPVQISVAQDHNGPWYTFTNGPYGDCAFPTNAFAWDRDANTWCEELDWLKPVNPDLNDANFSGLSAADAIDLYDGSAGGTGFDLKGLDPNDYAALAVDPNTGRKWIQYIKVESYESSYGEIDGFSDVAGCGDYQHPYPEGDLNEDCRVDEMDMALLCGYWLAQINDPNDPAVIADIYEDDIVNFYDWALLAGSWLECTWECE